VKSSYQIEIEAPRAVVFDFLADDNNLKKIVPNLMDAGVIQETPGA
jgi:carbon monoxide dehydrogenase subunit G